MHTKTNENLVNFVEKQMSNLIEDLIKRGILTSVIMVDYVEEKIESVLQELKEVN